MRGNILDQRNTIVARQYPCGQVRRQYLITRDELYAEIEQLLERIDDLETQLDLASYDAMRDDT